MEPTIKKAMVTGGAGFIGSHIVDRLISENVSTISIDNYSTGKKENLQHLRGNPLLKEIDCDITDRERLEHYMQGVDIIFHNAAAKKTIAGREKK